MNRIFKVIWSKAKNCYIVASELAKSRTKAPKSNVISRTLVVSVLTAIFSFGAVMPVWAADKDTVTSAAANTTKLFLLGHTAAGTAQAKYDSGIYATTTAGQLHVGSLQSGGAISGTSGTFSSLTLNSSNIVLGKDASQNSGTQGVIIGNQASIDGNNAVAIGDKAIVKGVGGIRIGAVSDDDFGIKGIAATGAVNIGLASNALGNHSVVLGSNASSTVDATNAVAIGLDASVLGSNSVAIGNHAYTEDSTASNAVAIGNWAHVMSTGTVAIGLASNISGNYSVGIGNGTRTLYNGSVAVGDASIALGTSSSALGSNTLVEEDTDLSGAFGSDSVATESNVISFGHKIGDTIAYTHEGNYNNFETKTYETNLTRRLINVSDGINDTDVSTVGQMHSYTTPTDNGNYVMSDVSAAVNLKNLDEALADHTKFVSINGVSTDPNYNGDGATGTNAIAIGKGASASNVNAIAIGTGNQVTGENSGAFGDPNIVNGDNSYVVGNNSSVDSGSSNVFVLGNKADVTGSNTVVLGGSSSDTAMTVSGSNSVILGTDSDGTVSNVISVGAEGSERRIIHVADGTSATDAATVGQTVELVEGANVTVTSKGKNSIGQNKYEISATDTTYTAGNGLELDGTEFKSKAGTNVVIDADGIHVAGNGTVSENNTGLMSGGAAYTELRPADGYYVQRANTTAVNLAALDSQLKTVTDGLASEQTTRASEVTRLEGLVFVEESARETGDTAILNKIGSITADGNYITKDGTVFSNLSALDTQVKANAEGIENITGQVGSLDALAVKYDSTDKGKVTFAGTGGTVISNVQAGTLSADSMEAVNGSQLYTTNQNLVAETAARTDADTTLSNRIGTLSEDGTVIHKDDSVSKNLKALDESLAGIRMSGVVYDDTAHTAVTLGDGTTAVKLDNVADGTLSADSREAVNGSQLYTTNQNLATEITERITAVTNEAAAREAADTALSDRIMALSGNAVQYDSEQKDNITLAGVEGTIIGNLKAGSLSEDSMEAVNGSQLYTTNQNLLAEKIAREEADAALGERIGTVAEDGAYIKKSSTNNIAANLSALDVQMKASTDDILGLKDLSNITDSGKTVIRDLAKGTVKVASGNFTNVVKGTDGNADSYTVNVVADGQAAQGNGGLMTGGAVYTAVKDAVDTVSSANISTENLAKWAEKLGTGTVAQDSSGLISGKTLYNEVHVADGNVIRATNTVGQNLSALDAGLKTVGTDVAGIKANAIQYDDASKTAITLGNGTNVTTIRNVAAGELSSASKDAVNGGQLYSVRDKLQKADGIDKGKWQEVLGDGQVELDNTGLVTGDTVYKAIKATAATASVRMIGINSNDKNDVNYSGGGAVGKDAVAVGSGVEAKGDNAVAMGKDSKAEGVQSVAIGHGSQALGLQSVVIGTSNKVTGNHSGAFGDPNYVTGDNSYAFGNNNSVSGSNTFVLGNNVKASGKNSVVLGAGSDGSEDNVVSVGAKGNERRITHVADGQTMTDAATVGQLSRLAQAADNGLRYLDRRVNKAGAGAAALAALHPLDMDGKFGMAAGYGNYHSTHAMALGLFYQPKDNVMFSIGGTIGNGDNMINAGVSIALDKGFTNSKAAMARNIRNLTAENAAMKEKLEAQGNEIKELKEMLMQLKNQMQKQ